jgi:isopenicillin N synthase-like dioxygenase
MRWVPLIDLTDADAPRQIGDACERVGFFAIANHGVAADVLNPLWSTARSFFDLPLDAKESVAMPYAGYPYGYAPVAYEALARSVGTVSLPDLKESFAIGPVDRAVHVFTDPDEPSVWSPNLWPTRLPTFAPHGRRPTGSSPRWRPACSGTWHSRSVWKRRTSNR